MCGIGRQSLLANGKCFQWLSNQSLTPSELNNGRNAGPGEVPFAKTVVHYKYPRRRLQAYDMALIKLTADLPLSSQLSNNGFNYRRLLNGICLPPLDALNSEDELALMAGYGLVSDTEESDRLKIGYIRIKRTYNNARDYWRMIILGERYPSYNGTFSCAGDSGAPLYQYVNGRAVLIGINHGRTVSNHKCDAINDGAYVIFVRISWVKQVLCYYTNVWSSIEMGDYPNITFPMMCDIGRQSLIANGKCFQWLFNQSLTHELNNGRNAGPGEVPFAV
ncbi:uncharacterized protein LOC128959813 [Oppia nitens]|uniref:uncharacterized protein LOC128959813 n=1 Tax=Oppia nitens TaxID=1686743 RepID=UPI0023D98CC7|nr:uncharacterized protein LOC128959813 [Oppia nitens]